MKIWEAIVLGIIQGMSEFLPISSSGHLLLLEKVGVGSESLFFNIMLHVGTLFAVLLCMRKNWIPLVRHPLQKTNWHIILTCVPTVALALVFRFAFPTLLDGKLLGCGFMLTALLLYVGQNFQTVKQGVYNAKTCALTGILQGIAVLPGVSRSGATISALTLQGVDKESATTFSFLLSIPIILGSALLEIIQLCITKAPLDVDVAPLIIGVASAFLSGLLSINIFVRLIKNHGMSLFCIYTLLLGIVVTFLPFITK